MLSYVCVIGTGSWQSSIILLLKENNIPIVAVGPVEPSVCVDIFLKSDVKDYNLVIREIESRCLSIMCFLTSQTDISIKTIGELNEHFKKNGITKNISQLFTNKYLQRKYIANYNTLKSPNFDKCNISGLRSKVGKTESVVKPIGLQSSLGVNYVKLMTDEIVESLISELAKINVDEVIIEDFIDGLEFTIEGYKRENKHEIIAISKKKKNIGFGIANELLYSNDFWSIKPFLEDDFNKLFSDYSNGPTHSEIIINESGCYLVEAAIRSGGSNIPSIIIPSICGFYPEVEYISDFGLNINKYKKYEQFNYVSLSFYTCDLETFPTVILPNGVIDHWSNYNAGDYTSNAVDDRSRHGYLIIGGNSVEQIVEIKSNFMKLNSGFII